MSAERKWWESMIPPHDRAVYEASGYGRRGSLGSNPALLVIDVTYGFIGREPLPLLESITRYPNSCGERGWRAMARIARVLDTARSHGVSIYYTAGITDHAVHHAGRWRDKHPRTLEQPDDAQVIAEPIAPRPDDVIIRKTKPSVFYGTPLLSSLVDRRVDTVIVTGCTTSGCVRATVVDAFSNGFTTLVIEDAVFDRGELSHAVNLFDMDQKYADVITTDDAIAYLVSVSERPPPGER
ncbi:MAG: isochorismatase family protein [Acidimicrobiales bacterium]